MLKPRVSRRRITFFVIPALLVLAVPVIVWTKFCIGVSRVFQTADAMYGAFDMAAAKEHFEANDLDKGWKRRMLWQSISAPGWLIPADTESVHHGALLLLLVTGPEADEEELILEMTREGHLGTLFGASLLAALWVEQEQGLEKAFALLDSGSVDQLIALRALPLVTGHLLDQCWYEGVSPAWVEFRYHELVGDVFTIDQADILAEWVAWRKNHPDATPQQAHTASFRDALGQYPETIDLSSMQPADRYKQVRGVADEWTHLGVVLQACDPRYVEKLAEETGQLTSYGPGTEEYLEAQWEAGMILAHQHLQQGLPPIDGLRLIHAIEGYPSLPEVMY